MSYKDYRFHRGDCYGTLGKMLESLPCDNLAGLGVVAEQGREYINSGVEVNEEVSIIQGVRHIFPDARSIITIGGERFGLILFDCDGNYRKFISNSACAAGTGSFLDQQASRLGLSGSSELSEIAKTYSGTPPKIATRCAVFARTDLIHIQQQGYTLPAISSGLCEGVALNIHDTLFQGIDFNDPVAVTGGVAKNTKVTEYLGKCINRPLVHLDNCELTGALGAALISKSSYQPGEEPIPKSSILSRGTMKKSFYYPPLNTVETPLPDFTSLMPMLKGGVEIDIYSAFKRGSSITCLAGFDIGSTSTKAVLMTPGLEVLLGLYTRTAGQPVSAIQKLTKAIEEIESEWDVRFNITGAGTTGSGRKFIQKVLNAEYAVDEITAHARAAFFLSPEIDTIIEIGGQDAKFTVLKNGNVTFSVMNYVCAAGTGSFIEEQAKRLDVPLSDYAKLAVNAPAPLISNRCTVFMERDLNHHLSMGYSKEELLAAALHSVRDNYLSKVAHQDKIGECITFQGATAKNYALVKAFEQALKKPIYVSKFCHLTGALGVCLKMADCLNLVKSAFRKRLHNETLDMEEYVCDYCNNNCKIKTISIEGETLGWGYLCGREERDPGYRKRTGAGFDLLREHRNVFNVHRDEKRDKSAHFFREFKKGGIRAVIRKPGISLARLKNRIQFNALELRDEIFSSGIITRKQETLPTDTPVIGLPATLNMLEYLPLWELFFKRLGFNTVATGKNQPYVKMGKEISNAEYCTPLTEFHGHIKELSEKTDYIFYPQLFENIAGNEKRSYCYYSHYAVPIIKNIPDFGLKHGLISPTLTMNDDVNEVIRSLFLSFPEAIKAKTTFNDVEDAYLMAWDWFTERESDLKDIFRYQVGASNDINIVLIGRPYLILNRALNKGIPDKLTEKGIQSFYMDMIPIEEEKLFASKEFIEWNHWHYGNQIIKTAEMTALHPDLFPVYITAFKCSPDSFIISYFKKIMDYYRKPYLVLQLDEHESSEGFETRLEAAIETFRGFKPEGREKKKPGVTLKKVFEDKTYILPDYDPLSASLIKAALERAGVKAIVMEHSRESFMLSGQINDGQCLPVSTLACGIKNTVEKYQLNPEKTAFYSNSECPISCNLPQYPVMIKQLLEKMGGGLQKVDVFVSRLFPSDMPLETMYEISMAYLLSGMVQKIVRVIRPREKAEGETDLFYRYAEKSLYRCLLNGKSKENTFREIVNAFMTIARDDLPLSKVGIVGDLYVRDNDRFNQNLVKEIETAGLEVVAVPFFDAMYLYAGKYFQGMWDAGMYMGFLGSKVAFNTLNIKYKKLLDIAAPILKNGLPELKRDPLEYLKEHGFTSRHGGETTENLLKVFYLHENHPGLKFIVNVNPVFCCPGLISEGLYKSIEQEINTPIISIIYDGSETNKNKVLKPYLHFAA